jgi:cyanophycin synthetase
MNTMDLLQKSLEARGYSSRTLILGASKKSFTQFSSPKTSRLLTLSTDSPLYPFATSSARLIANFKEFSYDLAQSIGVSIPESAVIEHDDAKFTKAKELLEKHAVVIVKPNSSSVSNGLTLNIDSPDQLQEAIAFARQYSDRVLVQRQVKGEEIRFAVADGKVRGAILRQTPGVTGNGRDTLAQLIDEENKARAAISDTAVPYLAIDDTLLKLDAFDMHSVPADGERVELGKGTMIRTGASIYNVLDEVHPSYIEIVEKLADQIGNGFAAVDVMLEDYTQPATDSNYAFIEFNLTPAIQLFYSCRDGKHFDVAGEYLAPMIDKILQD